MNKKITQKLEFDKILDSLVSHAFSAEAKKKCLEMAPLENRDLIEKKQQENADAIDRIFKDGSIGFGGIKDIRRSVIQSGREQTLSAGELMDVATTLEAVLSVRSYGVRDRFAGSPDTL